MTSEHTLRNVAECRERADRLIKEKGLTVEDVRSLGVASLHGLMHGYAHVLPGTLPRLVSQSAAAIRSAGPVVEWGAIFLALTRLADSGVSDKPDDWEGAELRMLARNERSTP